MSREQRLTYLRPNPKCQKKNIFHLCVTFFFIFQTADPYEGLDIDGRAALIEHCDDEERKLKLRMELIEEKRQAMRRKLGRPSRTPLQLLYS